ncbi:hypothetical protein IAE35_07250 [Pseudomonas sp. S75]|uniref:hypothetical protein n=1 Tax=unclassified Pseudomonas TaxID=196821 RepID=UPI001905B1EB|nr:MULTISPECIES: hypothetical protein [unclassified Pseudomonas]MBJ9975581.1 hypothetical protein [Pseudomonas sp. S30]MBK0153132.1 hypothetical protein [Pseudomonas sp. S75]
MIKLSPEKTEFVISTTSLSAHYDESGNVLLAVDTQRLENHDNGTYVKTHLNFRNVAELRCITLNFYESHHRNHEIHGADQGDLLHWKNTGHHPDPKIYQVLDSAWLIEKTPIYDPARFLKLKHYLIAGYDSYVELLAGSYTYAYQDR